MTYDDLARATKDGNRPARVQRGEHRGECRLDFGNIVTVLWDDGKRTRERLANIELAALSGRCMEAGR